MEFLFTKLKAKMIFNLHSHYLHSCQIHIWHHIGLEDNHLVAVLLVTCMILKWRKNVAKLIWLFWKNDLGGSLTILLALSIKIKSHDDSFDLYFYLFELLWKSISKIAVSTKVDRWHGFKVATILILCEAIWLLVIRYWKAKKFRKCVGFCLKIR